MDLLKRRQFLQISGAALTTIGMRQWEVMDQGDRLARVLANPTPRKLALLVGINQYPNNDELAGAVMDVELQRQLLMHRFGFTPQDILTVTDAYATRQNILTAFEEHLIKQAKPGDVVVFHFSGHGSRVSDTPDCDEQALKLSDRCLNSSFVPVDNPLSLVQRGSGGTVQDIGGHTLFLLMSALQTENVTVVLDCCHAGGGKRGTVRVRSLDGNPQLTLSTAELDYRRTWLNRLHLTASEFVQKRRAGVAKGVVIASVGRDRLAADCAFDDFAAGAFTYAMTQYLWQQTAGEGLGRAIVNIGRSTTEVSGTQQVPEFEAQANREFDQQPIYFLSQPTPPAEAVVTQLKTHSQLDLWLGGVPSETLTAFDQGAILTAIDASGQALGQVQLEPKSRRGLIASGKLLSSSAVTPKAGCLLQELVRGIPHPGELRLRIGLDPSLGDIAAAAIALQQVNRVDAITKPFGKMVHYLLGRATEREERNVRREGVPPAGSIGLFSPTWMEWIVDSFAAADEPVTAAIARLQPKFKSLLAVQLLRLMLNPQSSSLKLAAAITTTGSKEPFDRVTVGRNQGASIAASPSMERTSLSLGTAVQIQVMNQDANDLYLSVLAIDAQAKMVLLFPNRYTAAIATGLVKAGDTLRLPDASRGDRFKLTVQPPLGAVEILVIASTQPLQGTLKALQAIASRGESGLGRDPIATVEAFFDDLHQIQRERSGAIDQAVTGFRGVDTRQFAALSLSFIATAA
ncbi:MAG: caspase family protein [Leptolyngbya sp. BL-A-14]